MRRNEFCYRTVWLAASAIALSASAGCAVADNGGVASYQEQTMKQGVQGMLEEIYASGKPEGFEEIDVSAKVIEHFPLGSERAAIERAFADSQSASIVEVTPHAVVVRSDKGKAMFDVDPRSIVISFNFDAAEKLAAVEAIHFKNQ